MNVVSFCVEKIVLFGSTFLCIVFTFIVFTC